MGSLALSPVLPVLLLLLLILLLLGGQPKRGLILLSSRPASGTAKEESDGLGAELWLWCGPVFLSLADVWIPHSGPFHTFLMDQSILRQPRGDLGLILNVRSIV